MNLDIEFLFELYLILFIESFEKPSKLSKKDFERGGNRGYSKSSIARDLNFLPSF